MTLEKINEKIVQMAEETGDEFVLKLVVGTGSCWSCELTLRQRPGDNPRRALVIESVGAATAESAATEAVVALAKWLESAEDPDEVPKRRLVAVKT